MILGLGHDVVDVEAFAEQLARPGSRMSRLFSVRELRQAAACARAGRDGEATHLAAKWAGKEAALKAWCEALGNRPYPYTLDDFPWAGLEVLDDSRGRPHLALRDDVAAALRASLGLTPPAPHAARGVTPPVCVSAAGAGSSAKACSYAEVGSLGGTPPAVTSFVDAGAPEVFSSLAWHVSLSHDGPVASSVVILETV